MKKQLKSLLLVTLFACTTLPAWSQASTEGTEFWVANTIVCQPPSAKKPAFPTIAVSAQKACTVTITDYAGNQLVKKNVAAGSWTRFGEKNATIDPADEYLDPSKWYPSTDNINATDVYKHADKINNYGLHITATEKVSVYVIMRTPQYSMDASNALPITALQSEYYLQDFQPNANGVDKPVTMTTILATENNTKVDITPKGNTYGKTNNGNPYTITLNQGQTYYLISDVGSQLAGTHISAKDGKKIAVYVGSPVTRLPGGVAARDGLFEQMMPIDYWGTQFIATRSMQKDGNIIGITATQNGTELKIDGYTQTIINEGDTYYILLQGPADPYSKNLSRIECHIDQVITADAAYIETSCPCAVISYDTGNSFAGETNSEIVNGQGDPSSVWVSPIQQKINHITFGACYTTKTRAHFLNIVTETSTCTNTKLTAYMGQYGIDWSDKLLWTQVPGNTKYSYARVQIGDSTETINVFTLENSNGFIAHVYGNGEDESYAYSVGSAAVQQGINVDGTTYTHESRGETKLHVDSIISFDSEVGTDEITRVDWDFGDGITQNGLGVTGGLVHNTHVYTSPGWYDVTAHLFGHQVCTDESEMDLGTITFTIRVAAPDTTFVYKNECIKEDPSKPKIGVETTYDDKDFSNVIATVNYYAQASSKDSTIIASDLDTVTIGGRGYYVDPSNPQYEQNVDSTLPFPNTMGCDSIIHFHIKFATCLDIEVKNGDRALAPTDTLSICCLDSLEIEYKQVKGDVKNQGTDTDSLFYAYWVCNNDTTPIEIDNLTAGDSTSIKISTKKMQPGHYDAALYWIDENCNNRSTRDTLLIPVHLDVLYSDSIFKPKFGNTLALYKKGYGGNINPGWEFVAYQWYHDDEVIVGATGPVYYAPADQKLNGEYFVELTRKGETKPLRSCSQCFKDGKECEGAKSSTPPAEENTPNAAQKRLQNRQIVILRDGHTFNIYGQKVD